MADTPITDDTDLINQAIERAPKVLPEPIGDSVAAMLRLNHEMWFAGGDDGTGDYFVHRNLAHAVLALPVPAPAVDREGLGNDVVTEHAIKMSGGSMCVRNPDPEVERVYPLAQWMPDQQRFGGKVWRRRIRVVGDWVEVPPDGGEHRG